MKAFDNARVLILKGTSVLVMKRDNNGRKYFVFPGGRVEEGESAEEAALREVKEETGLTVGLRYMKFDYQSKSFGKQAFYVCEFLEGSPKLDMNSPEFTENLEGKNKYSPIWVEIKDINSLELYPNKIRDLIVKDSTILTTNDVIKVEED